MSGTFIILQKVKMIKNLRTGEKLAGIKNMLSFNKPIRVKDLNTVGFFRLNTGSIEKNLKNTNKMQRLDRIFSDPKRTKANIVSAS